MSVTAVIGAQWGDEGKGKMVDYLAGEADLVIRYQGGANAGHTIVNPQGTFKFRLVPSGVCYPQVTNLIGPGVACDPETLITELTALEQRGVSTARLFVDERATLVMPWHRLLDRLEEDARGAQKIGTTLKGVGPAFTDKAGRRGLKVGDLLEKDWLVQQVGWALEAINPLLTRRYGVSAMSAEAIIEEYWAFGQALRPRIIDSLPLVRRSLASGRILVEGQLGVLRDPDWGTYPYVTSSSPLAGAASVGAGIPPWAITRIVGVAKAYTTSVGEGPFPVEREAAIGDYLREKGGEFGVVTGRPRRCGWFDGVATRFAAEAAGITELALTKLDVLDGLPEVKLCTGYLIDGKLVQTVPPLRLFRRAEPVFESLPGWAEPTAGARSAADLPENARRYIRRIEEVVGVPVRLLSIGPERSETLALPGAPDPEPMPVGSGSPALPEPTIY
ncbi:MAG: adenylosuccinate synthase [Bacillota bacterium]